MENQYGELPEGIRVDDDTKLGALRFAGDRRKSHEFSKASVQTNYILTKLAGHKSYVKMILIACVCEEMGRMFDKH